MDQYFVFFTTRHYVDQLQQQAHGAVFDTIIVDTFSHLDVLKPASELVDSFADLVAPMFDLVLSLQRRNAALRETRDLLLPRLISGEVSVEGIGLPGEENSLS